jgi:hypothetical protein
MWVRVSGLPVTVALVTGPRDCNHASTRSMIDS